MSTIRSIKVIITGDNGALLALVAYSEGEALISGDSDVAHKVLDAIAVSRRKEAQPESEVAW